jgi:hypothetical protein
MYLSMSVSGTINMVGHEACFSASLVLPSTVGILGFYKTIKLGRGLSAD